MEGLGKYSYLIFLLIYLIYNFFGKSKKAKDNTQSQQEHSEGKSFEEILRDILGQETSPKTEEAKPQTVMQSTEREPQREVLKVEKMEVPKLANSERKIYKEEMIEIVELETHLSIIDEIHSGDFDFRKAIILNEIIQRPRYV